MRIRISHATTYAYDQPPKGVTQVLRLSPRDHDGQHVITWRIELSEDCLLHQHEDAFGNIIHSFTHQSQPPFRSNLVATFRQRSKSASVSSLPEERSCSQ